MNMPTTPPVRKAIRMAGRSPSASPAAAAATRTLPRTASDMPVNPVSAENNAPTTKKTTRPQRTRPGVSGQQQEHEEDQHDEDAQGPELAAQVRRRAFLDRLGDLLHLLGALTGRQYLPYQHRRPRTSASSAIDGNDDDPGQVAARYRRATARQARLSLDIRPP